MGPGAVTAVPQRLRELIRIHVTGPAVELAGIDGATVVSADLAFADAIELSDAIRRHFGVIVHAPRIPGRTVAELAALIAGVDGDHGLDIGARSRAGAGAA